MINIISKYKSVALALTFSFSLVGCTSYLDKTPDSDVSEETAFQNFTNFQGFIEEIYNCIPNKESCYWTTTFNWGEDEIMNAGEGDSHFSHQMDLGNYRNWMSNAQTYLGGYTCDPTSDNKFNHRLWQHAFYCIRKCNLALENLSKMTNCTQEERNFIEGQALFFRAWWHLEIMQYFGGLPYIDKVLDGSTTLQEPRLSYVECAEKAAADLEKAASLLPNDWDKTTVGKKTLGHNDIRITKVCALGYLGKCYLWAASPLMQYGAETNSSHSYDYSKELAQKAAEALGEAINEVNSGSTPYALAEFNYDSAGDMYNHKASSSVTNSYDDIFYTVNQNWKMPGTCEAIMRGVSQEANGSNWNFTKLWGSKVNSLVEHDKIIHMPTANYVDYAYGMANGEPAYIIENGNLVPNTAAGFDPTHPWKDRDPRFYHDIIFDGERYVNTTIDAAVDKGQQYFCGYSNSAMRSEQLGSRTGYFCQKLCDHRNNKYDGLYNWSFNEQCYLPYMRLAEIYLMYAEATAVVGGASGTSGNCTLTSEDAINTLRDRVGCGHVKAGLTGNSYMDEVRRERACELAFEGFRWNDLQRWLLLTKRPYNMKYSQEFERVNGDDWYDAAYQKDIIETTKTAEVKNFELSPICERQLVAKHYWFPFPDSDVYLYEGFPQNTGW